MVPDLTLEVIYLNEPTDFKMEFELCSSFNVRFLSLPVKSRSEFLTAISKSVVRSRTIIAVGSFNPLDKLYIPKIIAKATGYDLEEAPQNQNLKINLQTQTPLPKGSLPLVDEMGNLCGCVLENNDQSIIMLTSNRELRHNIVTKLVCPYLKLFAQKKTNEFRGVEITSNSLEKVAEATPQNDDMVSSAEIISENEQIEQTEQTGSVQPIEEKEEIITETENSKQEIQEQTEAKESNFQTEDESDLPKYLVMEQPENTAVNHFGLDEFIVETDTYEKVKKPKKVNATLKIIISIILVFSVALASYFGYDRFFQPTQYNSVYEEIKTLYGQKWENLPENMYYKFGKLYQTNSDIFGWLSVPDTTINLPVVSSAKKSTSYYRAHLFDGSVSRYGTLYTTSKSTSADYIRNLVIYGKNMGDGTMFSELENFLNIEVYKNAPTFTFDTLYFENMWKIFSVFKVKSENKNSYLKTSFFDDNEFSSYLEKIQKVSAIETNIDVTYTDQIVTLVSLGEKNDVILFARRVRDGESPMVDVTGVHENYTLDSSSDVPAIAIPLEPIETSSKKGTSSSTVDKNMIDGASSRYEQQAPVESEMDIKPTAPTIKPKPEESSDISSTSSEASSSGASSSPSSTEDTSSNSPVLNNLPMLTVTNTINGEKVKDNALSIIAQNIEAEMGSGYHIEALKAQAVAAYSWLLNNGSAIDKYPELPLKKASQICIDAANAVAGQVAVYNGKVATTYYHAISAGKTAYPQNIWTNPIDYCISVDSSVDKSVEGYQTVRIYSDTVIAQKAKDLLGIDLTQIEDKNKWFTCNYDANGLYCTTVKIGDVEKKGTYLRTTFFNYELRSSAYTIEYNETDKTFKFTVKGYGHGVGMSQVGANIYANSGWTYDKILKHYFTGITIGTYYV